MRFLRFDAVVEFPMRQSQCQPRHEVIREHEQPTFVATLSDGKVPRSILLKFASCHQPASTTKLQ